MKIAIINIGNELLIGQTLNSHHQWIAKICAENGWAVEHQQTIRDAAPDIIAALGMTMECHDVIIATGGLGPTSDDITRQVVAEFLGCNLKRSAKVENAIRDYFGKRKRPMPESVLIQADVPDNGEIFMNYHGTAPGLALQHPKHKSWLIMLPGPPRELHPMFREQILPFMQSRDAADNNYSCRILRSVGIGESKVQEMIEPELDAMVQNGLEIGYCARTGEVDIRLAASGSDAANLVQNASDITEKIIGSAIIGEGEITLEEVVVRLLGNKSMTVASAESCTGGFLAHRLTQVPGASEVFIGGGVTYANTEKVRQLGVSQESLDKVGAVSEEVAIQMAEGIRRATGADFGLSTTGIAGPGGGSPDKPVGLVFMAVATPEKTLCLQRINSFDRPTFKFVTTQQVLNLLRLELI